MKSIPTNSKWFVFAAIAAGMFLATIDGSIVNIALPTLERELHTQFAIVQWVVLGYLLTVVTMMLSIGRLADIIGKKWLYLAGMIVFTLGSMLCGTAQTVEMLIAFRVLQAVGAAMMMALGTAILTEVFPASERGKVLGLGGLMVSLGSISGPTLGGLILGVTTWHWIFYVNVPIGIIGTLLVVRFVPSDTRAGRTEIRFCRRGDVGYQSAGVAARVEYRSRKWIRRSVGAGVARGIRRHPRRVHLHRNTRGAPDGGFAIVPQRVVQRQPHHRVYGLHCERGHGSADAVLFAERASIQARNRRA